MSKMHFNFIDVLLLCYGHQHVLATFRVKFVGLYASN